MIKDIEVKIIHHSPYYHKVIYSALLSTWEYLYLLNSDLEQINIGQSNQSQVRHNYDGYTHRGRKAGTHNRHTHTQHTTQEYIHMLLPFLLLTTDLSPLQSTQTHLLKTMFLQIQDVNI